MLQDGKSCIFKITYQSYRCINIKQVIIGYFLPVQLLKHFGKIPEIKSFLVWILTVTQLFPFIGTVPEFIISSPAEVCMNICIVV